MEFTETVAIRDTQTASRSITDSDGQVISLEQELNVTPQFDEAFTTDDVATDSLVSDSAVAVNDNAIFGADFVDTASTDVLSGDDLRDLLETSSNSGNATGEVELFEVNQLSGSDAVVVADSGLQAGDLIDLSGIIGDGVDTASSAPSQNTILDAEESLNTDSGFVVEIDDTALSSATQSASSSASQSFDTTSGGSYRVQQEDTLWRIANRERAGGVTTHQMMIALLDNNPAAFNNGNINQMQLGAVLRLPSEAEQRAVSPQNASAIVQTWTRSYNISSAQPTDNFADNNSFSDSSVTDSFTVEDLSLIHI